MYSSESNKKRRLLSTSLNGYVMEWNLLTGEVKAKFNANAAIWDSVLLGKHLYLACEDGSIKVVKVKKEKLELVRQTPKQPDVRCLSLVCIDENTLFAGYSDGSIKKIDMQKNQSILHI